MKPEFEFTMSGNRYLYRPSIDMTESEKTEANERFERLLAKVEEATKGK